MNPPAVPRPPGVGGLPGRSPFHRLVHPLVRDAALHLDHGGGPDVDRVPRAGPSGRRRRCGCTTPATASSAPLPPRYLPRNS